MIRTRTLQTMWIVIALLAASIVFQAATVQATVQVGAPDSQTRTSKVEWNAYFYGDLPEGEVPHRWEPFAAIDSDRDGARASRDLWLKASLPEREGSSGKLLVSYYMVKPYEVSLYVDDKPIFTSDNVLPSGFNSWRLADYEAGDRGQVLLARISPHHNLDKGFEIWTGSSPALALKLLRTEAPMWAGAIVLTLFCAVSIILYGFNRGQALFIYFSVFFASLAIDLAVLGGGWQFAFRPDQLMAWGAVIHLNWYVGHASGILITHAIVGAKGRTWIRNLGYSVLLYAAAAAVGRLLFGEQAQLLFYRLFYEYISTGLLLVLAFVLFRALKRRRDTEIKVFAVGNVLFVGGLVLDRVASGQLALLPSIRTLLTSHHTPAQYGWTFIGFAGAIICLGIIIGMRLIRMAQLRATNKELKKVNSELQIANEKLARIDDIRSKMYSEVSHELNTPITAIKGYVQLMLNGTIPAGETRYLQVIRDKALVMERMFDNMLEIAKLENKHIQFEFEFVPFAAFYARLCSKVQLDMVERGFVFKWTPLPEPVSPDRIAVIYADPMRVEQVFDNLLSNARKFTPDGGFIRIESAVHESGDSMQSVTVRFIDSGCGIGQEERERIFERYYRGRSAKSGAVAGTGLGLPICREIMNAHDGEIGLERSSSDGSVFYIRFPLRLELAEQLESEETA